jgi:hypothetical protein
VRLAGLERYPKGFAGSEQMRLADHLLEPLRPHQFGERRLGLAVLKQVCWHAAKPKKTSTAN